MKCVKCGRSLEQAMKIYPHGLEGGAYCYDCGSAEKRLIQGRYTSNDQQVIRLHKDGLTASRIALKTGLTTTEVYKILNKGKRGHN